VVDQTPESWDAVLRTNLTGAFLTARAALPHLEQRGGSVVAVSSLAGLRAGPDSSAYCTSKAGLNMLVQSIAVDFGPRGVRANAVCPGWVTTEMGDRAMGSLAEDRGVSRDDAYRLVTRHVPLRRPASPEEIANCCLFLASDESSIVTGAVLVADGGQSAVDVGGIAFEEDVR
jgi:meso-butanediol dehydrogenase / (S,S)-butanediol dehydrogenase / diacetyl reductase